jgi:hypothetical protein
MSWPKKQLHQDIAQHILNEDRVKKFLDKLNKNGHTAYGLIFLLNMLIWQKS